jgi:transcriptional regulator with XRE-family HTH domain
LTYHTVLLKQARERAGLSADELGRALGMTRANISKYEVGRQTPTIDLCERMALVLKVKPEWLAWGGEAKE